MSRVRRGARHAGREAIRFRIVLGLALLQNLFGRRQQRNGFALEETSGKVAGGAAAEPDPGEVGLAVGQARHGTGDIG